MTQQNYQSCVAFVLKQEGGNTDTPGDRGGRTGRGGITHAVYDGYRTRKGLAKRDVFLITDGEIADIYRAEYWDPIRGDDLAVGVDLCVFDYAINSGPAKANAELRKVRGGGAFRAADTIHKICGDRLAFMHALGSWSRFGAGWGRRVAQCEATGLRMAGAPLQPVLDAAKAKQSKGKKQTGGMIVAGAPAGAGAHEWGHHGLLVVAAIVGVIMLLVVISAFNAWRHGQRADALGAAIKLMRDGEAAAFAAKIAADEAAKFKAKTIATEEAVLSAAREAITKSPFAQPQK